MSGVDLIGAIREQHCVAFVLVSAFMSIAVAVAAMKLGAFDVIEKPLDIEHLVVIVRAALNLTDPHHAQLLATPRDVRDRFLKCPRSVVERWVGFVAKACDVRADNTEGDLKTLSDWALQAGVSYTSLCETCRLIGIRPLEARDFVRVPRRTLERRPLTDT